MPFPFGPSPKRVKQAVADLGGWLSKYARERVEDMRSQSDLPRALMNPQAPGSREVLLNQSLAAVGSIGGPARGPLAKALLARNEAQAAATLAASARAARQATVKLAGAPKPPPVRYPAVKLPDGRIFVTGNGTHASIFRELNKSAEALGVSPKDLEGATSSIRRMDKFFGYLDKKKTFLTRKEAGQRRVARGESVRDPNDFDSFELPHIAKAYGGPVKIREINAPNVGALAKQLLQTIQKNKAGFSMRLDGQALVPATEGFSVGAGGVNKNTLIVPLDKLNLRQLTKWMKANPTAWRKGILGGWVNKATGNVEIEPATLVTNLRKALRLGRERGEKAIGDLAKYARGVDGTISLDGKDALKNMAKTGFAAKPAQSVVLPTTSLAGKVGTVEAVAAAKRVVGNDEFIRLANKEIAARGVRNDIDGSKAAIEETARRIYDRHLTGAR